MNRVTKIITDTSAWAASSTLTAVNLPREGIITEVTLKALITCTLTAAAFDDWYRRVFENWHIDCDGGKSVLSLDGTQMSRVMSLWQETYLGIPTLHSNGAGIALAAPDVGSTTFTVGFKWHPGSNPKDPFDLTAGIPARAFSTLQSKLTTTANNVLDSGGNITAGTFSYEVSQVLDYPITEGLMVPCGSTFSWPHDANYSNYSKKIDVPAGAFLRSILIMVTDDTGTVPRRKDDELTHIAFERPKNNDFALQQDIQQLQRNMAARYGFRGTSGDVGPIGAVATTRPAPSNLSNMLPAGWVIIDLRQYYDPLFGLDLRGYQTGDYKLGLTIANRAANDQTTIYWDQLNPVDSKYVGR